jgi:hypothetical protein
MKDYEHKNKSTGEKDIVGKEKLPGSVGRVEK